MSDSISKKIDSISKADRDQLIRVVRARAK